MIKRLRVKFVCVIMVIVTVLLLAIFGLICRNTWADMENASITMLQAATFEPMRPGGMGGGPEHIYSEPCFFLRINPFGQLEAKGSAHFDLSDEEALWQILQEAQTDGRDSGILYSRNLRYYKQSAGHAEGYAFMDITAQIQTMNTLVLSCVFIGLAALAIFFVVAYLLARWLVKPVEAAWNTQRQFVADASHELKTPLTVILTNAELLQSGEYDQTAKNRFVSSILTMSKQMRGLVESLLELARVDHGGITHQQSRLNLSELAEECVLPFEPVYFEAGRMLQSTITPGICVKGSAVHLRQVVDALLDNGQKYSLSGTTVELKLVPQGRGHCLLCVASQGAALTPQQCKDIFKRFYRADEARSMNRSYGLGLSIAEAIVQQHRGRIWCQSKNGTNTFYVSLPVHN